jgi:hypothetical protein
MGCTVVWDDECICDDPITDIEITTCTGDVDPADPLEDEDAYLYFQSIKW